MRVYLTISAAVFLLIACAGGDRDGVSDTGGVDSAAPTEARGASATAILRDAAGRELGTLTLTDTTGGIAVSGRLVGLAPGEHGLHLHTTGRCDPPAFESAGSHWNPANRQHGTQNPQGPHLGDLPNVSAGPDSVATLQGAITPGGSLRGQDMLLDADGAAVVIHSAPDDARTDPAGGAGDRVACGVVTGM